jgi:bifunctional enzyme CysN/CysC/sulfate adenylyltransferase subunit 1
MLTEAELARVGDDIEGFLRRHEQKQLLRFVVVGSVDDGKSTLIGRLLHDSHGVYEDQLRAVRRATRSPAGGEGEDIDFSLFTDGLRAEREQGITIDVAYRYFSTEHRKFIIADTPGHVQYTRNMATGASTADVAVILLDARLGVLPQSRRHAYIASLLGIRHLLVAVNKMDLVDWSAEVYRRLEGEFGAFAARLGFDEVAFFPISAKRGDNVVAPSERMPWFEGGTFLAHLERVPVASRRGETFRFPVQYVLRPDLHYRGFAGQIASGTVRPGDEVVVLPSGRRSRVRAVDSYEGPLAEATAPLSVTVRLEDEVDVSRGDLLAPPDRPPRTARRFDAMLVWLSERPLDGRRNLLLKHTSRMVPARIERVLHKTDLETLEPVAADAGLQLNDIGRVTVHASRPIFCDAYRDNRATGAFILIDALSNDTVAAGMILDGGEGDGAGAGPVTAAEREARLGQRGAALWIDDGVERARTLERHLFERGHVGLVLDGNELGAEALRELVVRAVEAGLFAIAAGGSEPARAAVAARLGEARIITAGAEATDEALVDALAARLAPGA